MRVGGATYMEIMAAGGGIMNTVRQTRAASLDDLVSQARPRLARMLPTGRRRSRSRAAMGWTLARS